MADSILSHPTSAVHLELYDAIFADLDKAEALLEVITTQSFDPSECHESRLRHYFLLLRELVDRVKEAFDKLYQTYAKGIHGREEETV